MAMARGRRFRITAPCGGRRCRRIGLLIATGAGCTNLIGDGLGFRMIRGAGLRITTGAGCMSMAAGVGGRVLLTDTRSISRFGRRLMCRSAASGDLVLGSVRWAGCRLDPATFSIRGGAVGAEGSDTPVSADTIAADLLHCARARASRT